MEETFECYIRSNYSDNILLKNFCRNERVSNILKGHLMVFRDAIECRISRKQIRQLEALYSLDSKFSDNIYCLYLNRKKEI